MNHFFERANGRLFGGRFAEDGEYQPRQGGNYDLLKSQGQGVVRSSADADDLSGFSTGATVGRIGMEVPASALRAEPVEGDRIRLGSSSFRVKNWKLDADGLIMKFRVDAL